MSISSASERPTAACTAFRGRSRRRAWLTSASGAVTATATSRCQPSGLLYADLWMPGAFSRSPIASASTHTISA